MTHLSDDDLKTIGRINGFTNSDIKNLEKALGVGNEYAKQKNNHDKGLYLLQGWRGGKRNPTQEQLWSKLEEEGLGVLSTQYQRSK